MEQGAFGKPQPHIPVTLGVMYPPPGRMSRNYNFDDSKIRKENTKCQIFRHYFFYSHLKNKLKKSKVSHFATLNFLLASKNQN